MNRREALTATIKTKAEEARRLAEQAEAKGGYSDAERRTVKDLLAEAGAAKKELDALKGDDDLRAELNSLGNGLGNPDPTQGHHTATATSRAKSLPQFTNFGDGRWGAEWSQWRSKTLIAPGQQLPVALPRPPIVEQGRPTQFIRSLIPHAQAPGGIARFMVQTARDNNAAVVQFPEPKPESSYSLEWVIQQAAVVAHTSEPMSRFDFQDTPNLTQFLDGELRYGLEVAIENMLVNGVAASDIVGGDEDGDGIEGFLDTSGLLAQDFSDDPLVSLRLGIGQVEAQGSPVTGILLNPQDWTNAEIQKDGQGRFMLDAGPADRAGRRLWGVPVVASPGVPAGQGILGDFQGSSALFVPDNGQVNVDYSQETGNSFVTNAVVWRAETRLVLGVLRPAAFCVVQLAGS